MGFKLVLDLGACQGYANCLIEAPDLFDFDEETDKAKIRKEHPDESLLAQAHAARHGCPARAIRIEET